MGTVIHKACKVSRRASVLCTRASFAPYERVHCEFASLVVTAIQPHLSICLPSENNEGYVLSVSNLGSMVRRTHSTLVPSD